MTETQYFVSLTKRSQQNFMGQNIYSRGRPISIIRLPKPRINALKPPRHGNTCDTQAVCRYFSTSCDLIARLVMEGNPLL